jgi:hypothetical protein
MKELEQDNMLTNRKLKQIQKEHCSNNKDQQKGIVTKKRHDKPKQKNETDKN